MKKIMLLLILSASVMVAQKKKNKTNLVNTSENQQNNPNPGYWQQKVNYQMEVNMNVENFNYTGKQQLVYTNNSPDTLKKVYFHLFYNAFQPGSEMDIRLQTIADPDNRMVKTFKRENKDIKESRISTLKPDEIGFLKVTNFKQNGKTCKSRVVGTVLEITLNQLINPKSKATFNLDFTGQVPLQIRRSGRNSAENVALSMSQWYPKMAEYDFEGWHADPYIAREFHGVWGDFDVKITLDKNYTIGSTGYLQNKNQIGHGYEDAGVKVTIPETTKTLTWHFKAPNVHDFAWGADNNFIHDKIMGDNNVELHFFYKNNPTYNENWKKLQPKTAEMLTFFNQNIGTYPYKQYSVIQGGDGGMEYAMCTLITGNRSVASLVGVTAHEFAHSWFQHLLATNESKHCWMDEGFTSYISNLAMDKIFPPKEPEWPHADSYKGYIKLANSGKEEPMTTHADRYDLNYAYGNAAYSKGEVFLVQLGYLIGEDNLNKTIKKYYEDYKFSHPTPNDIKNTAQKISGANLDWYVNEFAQTTHTIDYGIKEVNNNVLGLSIVIERKGRMPMPIELLVEYTDGTTNNVYIPLSLMRYSKTNPAGTIETLPWDWALPTFKIDLPKKDAIIRKVTIDPSGKMADVNKDNNVKEM